MPTFLSLPRALATAVLCVLFTTGPAMAVPSFARQTGQDCVACHIGGFGPQLTPFGVKFKVGGYVDSDGHPGKVPLSAMLVASYTRTARDQAAPPADGYKVNDNAALDEASVFLAGRITGQIGSFTQVTYDGIGKQTALDQMDLRFVHPMEVDGRDLVLGLSLNNNPGVQDPFNTLPVWGFPYTGSALGFGGAETGTLLNGALEQRVLGLSAYAFWASHLYAELGTYRALSRGAQDSLGLDPAEDPGRLSGTNVYWRLAWFDDRKRDAWSVGVFGFTASVQPDRAGGTPLNRYGSVGIDGQYQFLGTREHVATVQGSYIHENQTRHALVASGEAQSLHGSVDEWRINASYRYRQTWGATLGQFTTTGTADTLLYGGNAGHVPDTSGQVLQLDWTPFGKEDSWHAPWANLQLGLQYTRYARYNGASVNYDGAGRDAADNDTLFVFAWTAF